MAQALYRKWRPQRWEDVVGQNHVTQTLRNAVVADRVAHAYLFAGPRGTGKTTIARLLAKAVNCLNPDLSSRPCDECENCLAVNQGRFLDLIEIDAASNTSVDDVRDLRDKINFSPNVGRFKIYIIDEVHMLSTAAFNALLKTLEEPPPHAIFVLATTEIHKIPATVLSRCQRHEFRRIPQQEIVAHLEKIAASEKLDVDDAAVQLIARQSTGCMRDAISLLDQMSSFGEQITLDMTRQVLGTATNQAVIEMVDLLLAGDAAGGLEQIHLALDAGSDPRQFARQIVEYLRSLLLSKMGNADQVEATAEVRDRMARQAQALETSQLLRIIRVFNEAANEVRTGWQPALPLEIAFLQAMAPSGNQQAPQIPAAAETQPAVRPPAARLPNAEPAAKVQEKPEPGPEPKPETQQSNAPVDQESAQIYEKIKADWEGTIIERVNQLNRNTAALMRSGKLLGMRRSVLLLGFDGRILKQKMESSENLELIQEVLTDLTGQMVLVRCIALKDRQSEIPPDVDIDGMVAAALRDLGGKIVDVQ
jgi:DNA polymerase-3 subunit gamma/tau